MEGLADLLVVRQNAPDLTTRLQQELDVRAATQHVMCSATSTVVS